MRRRWWRLTREGRVDVGGYRRFPAVRGNERVLDSLPHAYAHSMTVPTGVRAGRSTRRDVGGNRMSVRPRYRLSGLPVRSKFAVGRIADDGIGRDAVSVAG